MWKWIGLFLRNNNLLMGLTFSSKLDMDSYTISIAKSSSKKIGPLIRSVKFLSPWGLLCISINLPYSHAWNIVLLSCLGQCSWLLLAIFLLLFDCPMTNCGPLSLGQPHLHQMFITAFDLFRPESHQEPCDKVGCQSLAKHLLGFEQGTYPVLNMMP